MVTRPCDCAIWLSQKVSTRIDKGRVRFLLDKKKWKGVCKTNGGVMSSPINYLLQTYIVTSNPKRISVADGLVHITGLLS